MCLNYEISEKTGYKWINRYKKFGFDGLKEGGYLAVLEMNNDRKGRGEVCFRLKEKYSKYPVSCSGDRKFEDFKPISDIITT